MYLSTTTFIRITTLALAAVSIALALPVYAGVNFTVVPFVIDKTVEPRDILSDKIVLTNTGTQPVSLYPSVHEVTLGVEGGIQEFVPGSMSDRTTSITSWIEISRRGVDLQVGESREVPLTFHINPNAAAGVYHAFIGFAHGGNSDEAKAIITRGTTPGVVVTLTIDEKKNEFVRLSKFLVKKFVTGATEGDVAYTVENTGDTVIMPEGDILLYNHRGEEVGVIPVNVGGDSIAPGESATFMAAVPTDGLLGKYRALLSVEYGSTQRASVQDTVFFYVFPWKKLLIAFGIFLAFALALSLWLHRRYLREDDDDEDDGSEYVPVTVSSASSRTAHPHDVNMKQ